MAPIAGSVTATTREGGNIRAHQGWLLRKGISRSLRRRISGAAVAAACSAFHRCLFRAYVQTQPREPADLRDTARPSPITALAAAAIDHPYTWRTIHRNQRT